MKVRLYKFVDSDDVATYGGMIDIVQVMNETELRNEFKNLLSNSGFAQELVADYYQENNLDEPDKLPIGVVLDMLNDSADYNSKRYFIVQEIDCEI
jgi:hypothetical protein